MAWLGRIACAFVIMGCNEKDPASEDAARLVAELCESAERCSCADDLEEDDCEVSRRREWDRRIEEARRLELTYDAECFETQIETAIEYGCWGASKFEPHLCEGFCAVFHGNRELGESCDGFDEVVSNCAQGLVCSDGRCVSPCESLTGLAAGERCMTPEGEPIETCALGLQCSYETMTCLALPELGQPCQGECSYGSWCDYNTYVCVQLRGEGEDCLNVQCEPELYCQYQFDGTTETATCLPYVLEGEACTPDSRCANGLGCAPDGVCRGPGGVGEPCNTIGCEEGLICDFAIDQCLAAPSEVGLPCPFAICGAGLWCDNAMIPEGVCQAKIATGERCSGHPQCESGYCPAAYCLERPAAGEDCSAVGICQYGLVCDGATCIDASASGPAVCSYRGW
jgi:hypothetical protein